MYINLQLTEDDVKNLLNELAYKKCSDKINLKTVYKKLDIIAHDLNIICHGRSDQPNDDEYAKIRPEE